MVSRWWTDSAIVGRSTGATRRMWRRRRALRQGLEHETDSCQPLLRPEKPCCCGRLGIQEAEDGENGHQNQEVSLDTSHGWTPVVNMKLSFSLRFFFVTKMWQLVIWYGWLMEGREAKTVIFMVSFTCVLGGEMGKRKTWGVFVPSSN